MVADPMTDDFVGNFERESLHAVFVWSHVDCPANRCLGFKSRVYEVLDLLNVREKERHVRRNPFVAAALLVLAEPMKACLACMNVLGDAFGLVILQELKIFFFQESGDKMTVHGLPFCE